MDPDSQASQAQRRIELQSPEDLAYLIANVRKAATAHLYEALPKIDGQNDEDKLREHIGTLINQVKHTLEYSPQTPNVPSSSNRIIINSFGTQYIDDTFNLAANNLNINGMPFTSSQYAAFTKPAASTTQAYEPFDSRKRQRVADLITQEEKLLEEVAALKRSVPSKTAVEQASHIEQAIKRDEELVEQRKAQVVEEVVRTVKLPVERLERQDGVESGFKGAVDTLGRLKRDMPAVVAKMERARVAGEYVREAK
ncbi:hypothetical protein QQS21_010696 [Conoideocrella luteorostrata]|uniref:Kinetochore protein mis14 n=1 Tax=Conoideocrella luteorostrata TaxID=1105319 RepID=A0AAJ0FTY4_9HYPO|nr:hypothetical protein QQS21_010696 [Conoideocrella luteorostrata]